MSRNGPSVCRPGRPHRTQDPPDRLCTSASAPLTTTVGSDHTYPCFSTKMRLTSVAKTTTSGAPDPSSATCSELLRGSRGCDNK